MNVMRQMLLRASQSEGLRERAASFRFIRRTAERFLPGEDEEAALAAAGNLAGQGIETLLTHLGENVDRRAEAESVTAQYLGLLERVRATGLPAEVSVKLTQLGLDLDRELCFENVMSLVEQSRAADARSEGATGDKALWVDMEQSPYVDVTLELYRRARKEHRNTGVCVQAYLYRTEKDVEALIAMGAAVRLVLDEGVSPETVKAAQIPDLTVTLVPARFEDRFIDLLKDKTAGGLQTAPAAIAAATAANR